MRTFSNQFTITDERPLTIPAFLLGGGWDDKSWGNEVCPRFCSSYLQLCVWVDYDNKEDREYNDTDWQKFTVVKINNYPDEGDLDDAEIFKSESAEELEKFLVFYPIQREMDEADCHLAAALEGLYQLGDARSNFIEAAIDELNTARNIPSTTALVPYEEHIKDACNWLCEKDDEHTCNYFMSTYPEAGPIAIILMMDKNNAKSTAVMLNHNWGAVLTFHAQGSDTVLVWLKEDALCEECGETIPQSESYNCEDCAQTLCERHRDLHMELGHTIS